ncbi:OmpH family outer membrane protein [Tahibacter amnicola]|uniref:OmpH family outer membrane protein n=1 Tax=Tahibacter amnicola TaxID=2976241 RepID=A0ABY6BB92_9GAMM|nr:OmpH family outer membrane protein [Tahibacter amnicola]UXI66802.1 OmpH family outer membrane protein [Tahibacter amnicola]
MGQHAGGPWILAAALALLPALAWAQGGNKLGYVDMKRLLDNAPQVQAGRDRLQQEFNARDAALKVDEARLAELKKVFERDGALLSKADADTRKREIDALERSVRRTREELRAELKTRSDQELDKSWQAINNAVVEYAREQGLDLVVPSPVVYADPRIDITDRVLDRLRRNYQSHQAKQP